MNLGQAVTDYNNHFNNNDEALTKQEKKWALLAGRATFGLESYIFKSVLPDTVIKPYIFPRAIEDMENFLSLNRTAELQDAVVKWEELKSSLNWSVAYEQVISSAKQSYLMVKPSPDILHELNEECRHFLDVEQLQKAMRTVLPIHLREQGEKLASVIVKLGLA